MARGFKSAKGAKKKCDVLYSKIVRSHGRCEDCGSTNALQTAHIISRRFSNTRTKLTNSFCLCGGCHHLYTDHPVEFGKFVENSWASAYYTENLKLANSIGKIDWTSEVERLKDIWEQIENGLTLKEARESS